MNLSNLAEKSVTAKAVSPALLFEVAARVFKGIAPGSCEMTSPEMALPLTGWQGVCDFRGPGVGSVGLRVSSGYAEILASAMAGDDVAANPEMQADAVGETVNILSSSLMALLYGPRRHVQIASPTVNGSVVTLPPSHVSGLVTLGVLIDSEHLVQVWLLVSQDSSVGGDS